MEEHVLLIILASADGRVRQGVLRGHATYVPKSNFRDAIGLSSNVPASSVYFVAINSTFRRFVVCITNIIISSRRKNFYFF